MNLKTRIASVAAASIFALSMGTAAFAQTTTGEVTQKVEAVPMTYFISGADLTEVDYSSEITYGEGDLTLDVNGNGNLGGWDLSVQVTKDFAYDGDSANGTSIPAGNLVLVSPDAPTHVAGQEINPVGPIKSTAADVSLGGPVAVISSPAQYGSGSYTQNLNVKLTVPAYSQVGTYTGEVTVSTTAAPN